jgi:hypothetical protein
MNEFYLTLPSDSSREFFPRNTIAHYRTKLSRRIDLENDDWNVGLAEISFRTMGNNILTREVREEIEDAGTLAEEEEASSGGKEDNRTRK